MVETKKCELCEGDRELTFHHLIPKIMHKKPRFLKKYTRKEMHSRGINIYQYCHSCLHDLFTVKQLGDVYNTKDILLKHEGVIRHIAWSAKQK